MRRGAIADLPHVAPATHLTNCMLSGRGKRHKDKIAMLCDGGIVCFYKVRERDSAWMPLRVMRTTASSSRKSDFCRPCHAWSEDGDVYVIASGRTLSIYDARGEHLRKICERDFNFGVADLSACRRSGTGSISAAGTLSGWLRKTKDDGGDAKRRTYLFAVATMNGVQVMCVYLPTVSQEIDVATSRKTTKRKKKKKKKKKKRKKRNVFERERTSQVEEQESSTRITPVAMLLQSFNIARVEFSSDATLLSVASLDGHVGVWATAALTGGNQQSMWHTTLPDKSGTRVTDMKFSPRSDALAVACWAGSVHVFERTRRDAWTRTCTLLSHRSDPAHAIAPTPNRSRIDRDNDEDEDEDEDDVDTLPPPTPKTTTLLPQTDAKGVLCAGTFVVWSPDGTDLVVSHGDRVDALARYSRCGTLRRWRRRWISCVVSSDGAPPQHLKGIARSGLSTLLVASLAPPRGGRRGTRVAIFRFADGPKRLRAERMWESDVGIVDVRWDRSSPSRGLCVSVARAEDATAKTLMLPFLAPDLLRARLENAQQHRRRSSRERFFALGRDGMLVVRCGGVAYVNDETSARWSAIVADGRREILCCCFVAGPLLLCFDAAGVVSAYAPPSSSSSSSWNRICSAPVVTRGIETFDLESCQMKGSVSGRVAALALVAGSTREQRIWSVEIARDSATCCVRLHAAPLRPPHVSKNRRARATLVACLTFERASSAAIVLSLIRDDDEDPTFWFVALAHDYWQPLRDSEAGDIPQAIAENRPYVRAALAAIDAK
eukprot:g253.t1